MSDKHAITVLLKEEVWKALAKMAKADGRTTAWLARTIIEKAVEKKVK
jgi:predicted DNA-binding protein